MSRLAWTVPLHVYTFWAGHIHACHPTATPDLSTDLTRGSWFAEMLHKELLISAISCQCNNILVQGGNRLMPFLFAYWLHHRARPNDQARVRVLFGFGPYCRNRRSGCCMLACTKIAWSHCEPHIFNVASLRGVGCTNEQSRNTTEDSEQYITSASQLQESSMLKTTDILAEQLYECSKCSYVVVKPMTRQSTAGRLKDPPGHAYATRPRSYHWPVMCRGPQYYLLLISSASPASKPAISAAIHTLIPSAGQSRLSCCLPCLKMIPH
jgi:hypothetical protein